MDPPYFLPPPPVPPVFDSAGETVESAVDDDVDVVYESSFEEEAETLTATSAASSARVHRPHTGEEGSVVGKRVSSFGAEESVVEGRERSKRPRKFIGSDFDVQDSRLSGFDEEMVCFEDTDAMHDSASGKKGEKLTPVNAPCGARQHHSGVSEEASVVRKRISSFGLTESAVEGEHISKRPHSSRQLFGDIANASTSAFDKVVKELAPAVQLQDEMEEKESCDADELDESETWGSVGSLHEKEVGETLATMFVNDVRVLPVSQMMKTEPPAASVLCKVPTFDVSVSGARSFLIDMALVSYDDLSCDSFGRWNSSTCRCAQRKYFVDASGSIMKAEAASQFTLIRRYWRHPDAEPLGSFKKICWTLHEKGSCFGLGVVSYDVSTSCKLVQRSHGNTKKSHLKEPCVRTCSSTLQALKERRKNEAPCHILPQVALRNGITGTVDDTAVPRNLSQLYNMSRSRIPTSRSYGSGHERRLIEELYDRSKNDKSFVRDVALSEGSDRCFMYTDSMMESLKLSCVTDVERLRAQVESLRPPPGMDDDALQNHFTDKKIFEQACRGPNVMFLDMTFNLCQDLYVTLVVFRHRAFLVKGTSRGALRIGAIALTSSKKKEDYAYIGEQLYRAVGPEIRMRARAVVTDSEAAIEGLFSSPMFQPPCLHLLCELHLRRNTESLLKEVAEPLKRFIMSDIYGSEVPVCDGRDGRERFQGLCDGVSAEHFDRLVEARGPFWEAACPGFMQKFLQTQGRRMKDGYILPHRVLAGQGTGRLTTNCCENSNKRLKSKISDVTNAGYGRVVDAMQQMCEEEYASLAVCVHGTGHDHVLAPEFQQFWRSVHAWNSSTQKEREKLLRKLGIYVKEEISSNCLADEADFPPLLRRSFTDADRAALVDGAKQILMRDHLQAIRGETYVVDINKTLTTIRYEGEGAIRCDCRNARPLCTHALALAMKKGERAALLRRCEETLQNITPSDIRAEKHTRNGGKKPGTRLGVAWTASAQNCDIISHVLLPTGPLSSTAQQKNARGTDPGRARRSWPAGKKNGVENNAFDAPTQSSVTSDRPVASSSEGALLAVPGIFGDYTKLPTPEQLLDMDKVSTFEFTEKYHNREPFEIIFANNLNNSRLKKPLSKQFTCASCQKRLPLHMPSPNDLVLLHMEQYQYAPGVPFTEKKKQQRYLHASLNCVLKRYPYFTTRSFLTLGEGMALYLTPQHWELLRLQFGYLRKY